MKNSFWNAVLWWVAIIALVFAAVCLFHPKEKLTVVDHRSQTAAAVQAQAAAVPDPVLQMLRLMTNQNVRMESAARIGNLECLVEYGWDGRDWKPVGTNFGSARSGEPRWEFRVGVRYQF